MPDHIHFLCFGYASGSDQRTAVAFIRTHLRPSPFFWQGQPHDRVLKDEERKRGAIQSAAHYLLENPVRAGLVSQSREWPYLGSVVAGYPKIDPCDPGFWEVFWKIDGKLREKASSPPPLR